MISTTKNNISTGIVIKKFSYNECHEIIHIITEEGLLESFFYENVNKNKKKSKVTIPCEVNINYFKTSGMNKIINIEVEDYYTNIIYDISKSSYVGYILEILTIIDTNEVHYILLRDLLQSLNYNNVDEQLVTAYFICKLLKFEGFTFKYIKTDKVYQGYSLNLNMFIDYIENRKEFYKLDDKLVKLLYILSNKDIKVLEKIYLEFSEYKNLINFLNVILLEYIGIETKSHQKIIEIEELLYNFERNANNE